MHVLSYTTSTGDNYSYNKYKQRKTAHETYKTALVSGKPDDAQSEIYKQVGG